MVKYKTWCVTTVLAVGKGHALTTLSAVPTKLELGIKATAKIVPTHYASAERLSGLLKRLGKPKVAAYIQSKLPKTKNIRSGDLGEILAASYVNELTSFGFVLNRLRWKDHRNMAMRGDDVLGIRKGSSGNAEFLKGEVKSSVALTAATVTKARGALKANNNRPSAHALSFVADRLHDQGQKALADLIDDAQLKAQIPLNRVSHMLFTFSGNDGSKMLRDDLVAYKGTVKQHSVALVIQGAHQKFIKDVYQCVIENGGDS